MWVLQVDTLEISLKEQLDMVDRYSARISTLSLFCLKMISRLFLVEATVTHKGHPKPLMWERLKFTQRFDFVNSSKVIRYTPGLDLPRHMF